MLVRPSLITAAPPRGGFGNRLLTFMSLAAIARRLEIRFQPKNLVDRPKIQDIHSPALLPLKLRKVTEFREPEALAPEFIDKSRVLKDRGFSLLARGPFLGEVLATYLDDSTFERPQNLMTVCAEHVSLQQGAPLAGVHIRGGDFIDWDPSAVLPVSYYMDAIDYQRGINPETMFRVFTDDFASPVVQHVVGYLGECGRLIKAVGCEGSFECDFSSMVSSKVLISSPSTFAVAAGFVGGARIIHSEGWVKNRIEKGEHFWVRVRDNTLPGYAVESLI